MATQDKFKTFLKAQKKSQGSPKIDLVKRKSLWLASIDVLYQQIKWWLREYEHQGLLTWQEIEVTLSEEPLGDYTAKRLLIQIGDNVVKLVPKGTLIVGAYGRIDLQGPKDSYTIVEPDWDHWKIFTRTQREMADLTEKSFKSILQLVV